MRQEKSLVSWDACILQIPELGVANSTMACLLDCIINARRAFAKGITFLSSFFASSPFLAEF